MRNEFNPVISNKLLQDTFLETFGCKKIKARMAADQEQQLQPRVSISESSVHRAFSGAKPYDVLFIAPISSL